jgi:Trk K+ transport system NAD-binding subunit
MDQHIILCGLGRVGWHVLDYLRAAALQVVIIDTECAADDPRLNGVRLVRGDCRRRELLEQVELKKARGVLIMIDNDLINVSTALTIRSLRPDVRIVMRLFDQNFMARLGKAVSDVYALSTEKLTAPLFTMTALTGQALGRVTVGDDAEAMLQIAAIAVDPTLQKPIRTLIAEHQMQVLAHLPCQGRECFLHEVDPEATLQVGDRLFFCGSPGKIATLLGDDARDGGVHWAGWIRRFSRVAWRTMADVDLAVKICVSVFLGVVCISTLILHFGVEKQSWAMAVFRTISLMATGGDMHAELYTEKWQLIYVSVLRVLGAALTAAFTAIITNYLLRARLGGALEFRRIPDSGHVVVVGLGNIGYEIVQELIREGERVVVIEKQRDGRFVTTTRRLGVPVLIGDGTVSGVLRQAHCAQARAVIAVTSNDLFNVEIGLAVRELNLSQRVVLRLSDPELARTLREAANIRFGLSITALAAPAFVAALFGDRVQNVFLIEGRMFATFDLVVPEHDVCLAGQSVRAVAIDYNLMPVAVLDNARRPLPTPLSTRLEPGFRLIAISTLADLQRLLRREPVPSKFAVDVLSFPLPARDWVSSLLRVQRGLSAEQADQAVGQLPVRLCSQVTRGQAEDMLALLNRERVVGKLCEV